MTLQFFRLEFSEVQQCFHNNYGNDIPESNTYFTIFENCTDLEAMFFQCFIERNGQTKFTKEYLLKQSKECKSFLNLLVEHRINISSEIYK
jgi:hypothetical protein